MKKLLAIVLVMLLALAFVTDNTVITVKGYEEKS